MAAITLIQIHDDLKQLKGGENKEEIVRKASEEKKDAMLHLVWEINVADI